ALVDYAAVWIPQRHRAFVVPLTVGPGVLGRPVRPGFFRGGVFAQLQAQRVILAVIDRAGVRRQFGRAGIGREAFDLAVYLHERVGLARDHPRSETCPWRIAAGFTEHVEAFDVGQQQRLGRDGHHRRDRAVGLLHQRDVALVGESLLLGRQFPFAAR